MTNWKISKEGIIDDEGWYWIAMETDIDGVTVLRKANKNEVRYNGFKEYTTYLERLLIEKRELEEKVVKYEG